MEISNASVKKIMKSTINDKPVSNDAVQIMREYLKSEIIRITKESNKILCERNKLRKIQGIKPKIRLNEDCVKEVLVDAIKNN